jgi:hypothetical protein
MTPQEIRTEILASTELRALIEQGRDEDVARNLTETMPGKIVSLRISELGLLSLYSNPVDGETVLQAIEAVAQANPIIRRVLKFMQPGVPEASLPDFSLPGVRLALTVPVEQGGLGLSTELAAPLLSAMTVPDAVTAIEVSEAVSAWRPEGKICPIPEGAN